MPFTLYLIYTFLFLAASDCSGGGIGKADKEVLRSFGSWANEQQLAQQPLPQRIARIARFFLERPYESNTLDKGEKEELVVYLQGFDCVTLVENVLALSALEAYDEKLAENFRANLMKIRYRRGEIEDYTSRLHYSSDWLYEMERQGLLQDITAQIGGVAFHPRVNFMSRHARLYPPLEKDKRLIAKMENIETAISRRTYHYIPKASLEAAYSHIDTGDILLITTTIKGLDTSHLGIALKREGQVYLLHASSKAGKVMITEKPLAEYMAGIPSQSGIIVARATDWHGN